MSDSRRDDSKITGADVQVESDVIHLNILGQPLVVLNSFRAAVDLLEKRGTTYSDRPKFPFFEM